MDFDKKWNHSRTAAKIFSLVEMQENALEDGCTGELFTDLTAKVETTVFTNMVEQSFWETLSEKDRALLQLRMSGMSQAELTEQLHYKTHSAMTKRLQKRKELFLRLA